MTEISPSARDQQNYRELILQQTLQCLSDVHCRPMLPRVPKQLHVVPLREEILLLPLPMPMFKLTIRHRPTSIKDNMQVVKQRQTIHTDIGSTPILQTPLHSTIYGPTCKRMQLRLIISPMPCQIAGHTNQNHHILTRLDECVPRLTPGAVSDTFCHVHSGTSSNG